MSALMLASAGEFAAISMIGSGAGFMEMIITTVVINMRYLLMSRIVPEGTAEPAVSSSHFHVLCGDR